MERSCSTRVTPKPPAITAIATAAMTSLWPSVRVVKSCRSCSIMGVSERSDLHSHDFLIGGDNLVPRLHEDVELEIRALRGEDGGVQFLILAGEKPLHRGVGPGLRVFHFADGAGEHSLEIRPRR